MVFGETEGANYEYFERKTHYKSKGSVQRLVLNGFSTEAVVIFILVSLIKL